MNYYPLIVAALVSLVTIAAIRSSRYGISVQDIPNERSLHSTPVPRIGGVGLLAGILSGWSLISEGPVWWVLLPLTLLFVVSLLEDIRGLPVSRRLSAQLIAAAILVFGSGFHSMDGIAVAFGALLFTVWMVNLYNFMDGADGLAGGMAFLGFGFLGVAAQAGQAETLAMLNYSISAAAIGFLRYNFPPARVFMGDAGSIPLGFLVAAMGLWGWQQGCWEWWFPLLVFSPFIADASVTLVKRSLRGARVTEAHREHYYQRVIQMGRSHRQVALVEYALMLGVGLSAIFTLDQPLPLLVLISWGGIYAVLMLAIDLAWRKSGRGQHAQG